MTTKNDRQHKHLYVFFLTSFTCFKYILLILTLFSLSSLMDVIQMKKKKQSLRKHFKSNHNIILMFFTIPEEIKMTNKETKILYYI